MPSKNQGSSLLAAGLLQRGRSLNRVPYGQSAGWTQTNSLGQRGTYVFAVSNGAVLDVQMVMFSSILNIFWRLTLSSMVMFIAPNHTTWISLHCSQHVCSSSWFKYVFRSQHGDKRLYVWPSPSRQSNSHPFGQVWHLVEISEFCHCTHVNTTIHTPHFNRILAGVIYGTVHMP